MRTNFEGLHLEGGEGGYPGFPPTNFYREPPRFGAIYRDLARSTARHLGLKAEQMPWKATVWRRQIKFPISKSNPAMEAGPAGRPGQP